MRFATLANERSWYATDLRRAIVDAGHEATLLNFRTLQAEVGAESVSVGLVGVSALDYELNRVCLGDHDAVIVRTMPPGSLEQVVFRMDVLGQLAQSRISVVNSPRSIECAVDKLLTTMKLAAAGLPVPGTAACESVEQAMACFEAFGRDVVLKPLFGAEGRGIVRLTDEETAFRVCKSLRMTEAVFYVQKFVQHAGFDVRLMVLDGKVVACMKRVNELDFRTNVNQKGTAVPYDATELERDLAVRSAAATGTRIAGVDIIRDQAERPFVLEVNAVPGWKALAAVTGIDVAAMLVQSIEKEARRR